MAPRILLAQHDIVIAGETLDGEASTLPGWQEHYHPLEILASHRIHVTGNRFHNLSGDGIYVDQGSTDLTLSDNRFDGVNYNRNGISIVEGRHVRIEGNTFTRMTRPDMPGAIDLEPNYPHQVVSDISIAGNLIDNRGGSRVKAGITVYNAIARSPHIGRIIIEGNTILGNHMVGILLVGGGDFSETEIVVRNNRVEGADAKIRIKDMRVLSDFHTKRRRKRRRRD
jgi:hypothetical protein